MKWNGDHVMKIIIENERKWRNEWPKWHEKRNESNDNVKEIILIMAHRNEIIIIMAKIIIIIIMSKCLHQWRQRK